MRKQFGVNRNSLVVQLVLSFMALVLLTTMAIGLPAILLTRNQIERQAWARVNQGSHATQTLYAAWQRRLADLVLLTSQRPTLHELLSQEKEAALSDYLQTLQEETGLDMLLVCDPDQRPVAYAGTIVPTDLCRVKNLPQLHTLSSGSSPQVWMLAAHVVGDKSSNLGQVIVGMLMDDAFSGQMSAQTSLEHTLLVDEQPVASSFTGGTKAWRTATRQPTDDTTADIAIMPALLYLDNRPYYTTRLGLDAPGLTDEIALDVADIASTERRLTWTLAGSIVLVALVGSAVGALMARRIGRPLTRLAHSATKISLGDLDTSLSIPARVHEVTIVSQALESARVELQRTLTELRRAQAWTDHLLETIVEGIVALDEDDHITFFSPGAERITGWNQDDTLNRSCDELFHLAETSEPFSQFIPLPGQQRKIILELADGYQPTLSITSARLMPPDTDEAGIVLVLRDVSEAERVHRLLGEFLANITHEFRTPLSALAASTELLLDQAPDLGPVELRELLTSLYLGIVRLQMLIDNLLESASLEAGRFHVYPRPSDLGEIIAEATQMMRPLQEKYGQGLVVELPTTIPLAQADPRRIVQVLVNLLSNAIQYSPDKTESILSAVVSKDWVRVAIADRGPGVPLGKRSKLFQRFVYYGAEESESRHGAGLGLSVVKAIVEAHGGQVGVDDRPGGGSVFWFTLPNVDEQ